MKYPWEIFELKSHGLYANMTPRVMGTEEADSPEEVAERIRPQLRPGQELNIWDTPGVGRLPVLSIKA
jgi:hypothetical protein